MLTVTKEYAKKILMDLGENKVLEFPAYVKGFEDRCFEKTGVAKVTIPKDTEVIGAYMFSECEKLKEVIFENECRLR